MSYRGVYKASLRQQDSQQQPPFAHRNYTHNQNQNNGPAKHWKSYLAPELAKPSATEYSQDHQSYHDHVYPNSKPRYRLEGARSAGNLNELSRLDRSDDDHYGHPRRDDYARRKDDIMNRIKMLQQKAPDRDRNDNGARRESGGLQLRLQRLQERVQQMQQQFQSRVQRAIEEIESRLSRG